LQKNGSFRGPIAGLQENNVAMVGGLVALSLLLYVLNLGGVGLWEKHEQLYAEVAREMLVDGHWIIPHFGGEVYAEKPPLYFWMVALCSMPLGDVNEFTARLPSALCAMGTVLVTFFLGKRLFNTRVALIGAFILASSLLFIVHGRRARLDTTFVFFISSALLAFYSGYTSDRKTYYFLLFWFLIALAVLTKGLFALFLAMGPIIFYLFWNGNLRALVEGRFLYGGSVFILIITAWLLPAYVQGEGDYIRRFILENSGMRHTMVLTEAKHHHSVLRYVFGYLLYGMAPWSILLVVFSYRFFAKRLWIEHRQLLFPGVWFFVMLFIFILLGQKRSTYLLPLYPPAALLIAAWWDGLIERSSNTNNSWLFKGLGGLLAVTLGVEVVWVCQGISSREMIVGAFTIFLILAFGLFLLYSNRFKELFIFLSLIAISMGVSYTQVFLSVEKKGVLYKAFFHELNSSLGQCRAWTAYGDVRRDVLFYSKIRPKQVNSIGELKEFFRAGEEVYCLMTAKDYSVLASQVQMRVVREFPGEGLFLVSN
ncbi:MAG: ArnT family glycosyltransferase, partial [Candidatus Brocadiales bacterium]